MKKILWTVFIGVIIYAVGLAMFRSQPQARAQALPNTEYGVATATPSPRPTRTPVPSATIGYEQTAAVAQSTAMEAVRVNAQITAAYEERIQQQMITTAQYEQRVQEIYSWTATAALTSIPLTATQQVLSNTETAKQMVLQSAGLTATKGAPTQVYAMAQSINAARYGWMDHVAGLVGVGVVAIFALAIVAWVIRNPIMPRPAQAQHTEYTVINRKREAGPNNGYQSTRFVVPCSAEQLTELAQGLTRPDPVSWAINQWEGAGKPFTRDGILRVRAWARDNRFVLESINGELITTDAGTDFLIDWLDSQQLPDNYAFEAENAPTSNPVVDMAIE